MVELTSLCPDQTSGGFSTSDLLQFPMSINKLRLEAYQLIVLFVFYGGNQLLFITHILVVDKSTESGQWGLAWRHPSFRNAKYFVISLCICGQQKGKSSHNDWALYTTKKMKK